MLSDCDLYYPKRATKRTFIRQGISACATSCHWQSILSRRLTIHNRHLIDTLMRIGSAITCQRIPRSMVFVGSDIRRYAFYRHGIGFFYHNSHAIQVDGNVVIARLWHTKLVIVAKSGEVSQLNIGVELIILILRAIALAISPITTISKLEQLVSFQIYRGFIDVAPTRLIQRYGLR